MAFEGDNKNGIPRMTGNLTSFTTPGSDAVQKCVALRGVISVSHGFEKTVGSSY